MNGALWIVVIAALSTTKWPQLSWLTGSTTAVLVVIVATVYWIAVVTNDNDNDKSDSTAQRQSTQLATGEEAQGGRNVAQERPSPQQQHEEITEAYLNALRKNIDTLRNNDAVLSRNIYEFFHRRLAENTEDEPGRIWSSNFDEVILRDWLVHVPHHGAALGSLKSHRRAFTTRTLARIAAGEEETSGGKVVVMVGSVRIEIQEDDPNKTTNVHITSPKTVVTNVTDTAERNEQKTQEYGSQRPTTTIH
jgi:hypothetical protein